MLSLHRSAQASLTAAHRLLRLWHTGSVVAVCRLSFPEASEILVSQPGIQPTPPALEGRFLTDGPPGKFSHISLLFFFFNH